VTSLRKSAAAAIVAYLVGVACHQREPRPSASFQDACLQKETSQPFEHGEGISYDESNRILEWLAAGFATKTAKGSDGLARVRLILPSGPGAFSVKMVGKTPPEGVTETWNYIVRIRKHVNTLSVDVLSIEGNLAAGSRESWEITLATDGGVMANGVSRFPEDDPLWGGK
jgi:hypothetical protein